MKKLSFIMIALLAGLSFSCGLTDKADVNFDVKLQQDFDINTGSTLSNPYTFTKVLDATADSEFAKYKDKIKEIKVTKITYKITGLTPSASAAVFTNGTVKIDGATTVVTQSTLTLSSANNAAEAEFTSTDINGINALGTKLKSDKTASIQLQGTLSTPPVAFKLTTYYYLTVTANALK